jgi:chorismate synthase
MSNTFGKIFRLTSFGESHGKAIGGVIDGMPSNIVLDFDLIQRELNRRKPGQSHLTTSRSEADKVIFLSGIFEGKTTGTPIGFIIENNNLRSTDYLHLKDAYRPSHADFTYEKKYGIRDYRGGGRASARTTASIVVAGALARHVIPGIKISAYVNAVGDIGLDRSYKDLDLNLIEQTPVRCPDLNMAQKFIKKIEKFKKQGDTVGGQVTCVVQNVPQGLGEPVFDKLQARLAYAMLNIPAVKGFEYGSGFSGSKMTGSRHNDIFNTDGTTQTNYSGGIQGGISNGMDIYFTLAFKPVATLMKPQQTIDKHGNIIDLEGKGRHDPCVVPRAVPIVEAFTAMVLADFLMMPHKNYNAIKK